MREYCVYPGTFDPITLGHENICLRAAQIFDTVYFAVSDNQDKSCMFSLDQRIQFAKDAFAGYDNIVVMPFEGILVSFMLDHSIKYVIRGIRTLTDYEYEFQIAYNNKRLYTDYESIFLLPDEKYIPINSKIVRNLIKHDGPYHSLLSDKVSQSVKACLKS